ncbi:MAG: pilM [Candidatus Taylorbacteria bacterium]|nr:pilM [Candidatus Taylorbacteria bacterium]
MIAETFFKLFPTPKFLDMPYAGLHISDDAIRVIQFSHGRHSLEVVKHGCRLLSPGIVEAGYVKDEKALSKLVSELASELGITFVRVSIPEEKMYLFKTDIAASDEKQISQNIEFKLEENVPLSPADALFYFDVIPSAAGGKRSAMVSVAPRKVIDAYLNVLADAKLTALSFEVEAKALARAFVPKGSGETELVINIMSKKTGIYVICEGIVSFTSTVSWGGDAVTEVIEKAFDIKPAEAIEMKKSAGFHDGKDTKKILAAIQDSVAVLQKEIYKVYTYWIEHGEGCKDINRIVLCGADAQLVGLISHISPDPKIPVDIGNVWQNAFSSDKYIPPISHEESLDYAVAAGLALPQQ